MLWAVGMRGAVAYGLVVNLPRADKPGETGIPVFETATLLIVVVSTLGLGSATSGWRCQVGGCMQARAPPRPPSLHTKRISPCPRLLPPTPRAAPLLRHFGLEGKDDADLIGIALVEDGLGEAMAPGQAAPRIEVTEHSPLHERFKVRAAGGRSRMAGSAARVRAVHFAARSTAVAAPPRLALPRLRSWTSWCSSRCLGGGKARRPPPAATQTCTAWTTTTPTWDATRPQARQGGREAGRRPPRRLPLSSITTNSSSSSSSRASGGWVPRGWGAMAAPQSMRFRCSSRGRRAQSRPSRGRAAACRPGLHSRGSSRSSTTRSAWTGCRPALARGDAPRCACKPPQAPLLARLVCAHAAIA